MKQTNLLKTFLLLCALVVGSTCAWADDVLSWTARTSSKGSDTYTSGYTYTTNKISGKDGYVQDSGTKNETIVSIALYKTDETLFASTPAQITFSAKLGGGSAKDPLDYNIYACFVDNTGADIADTEVTVTTKITTPTGSVFSVNMPTSKATQAYGVKIYHMKEDSWNARYYNFTLSYSNQVDATWTLSPAIAKTTVGESTTLDLTTNYDGTLSFASNDEDVATVSYNSTSKKITVNGIAIGTTTISVTGAATENFNAINKTINVVVSKSIAANCVMYESFDVNNEEGGNDGTWKNIATVPAPLFDLTGWTYETVCGASQCVRVMKNGYLQSPAIGVAGNVTLTFKTEAWGTDTSNGYVDIIGGGTFDDSESITGVEIQTVDEAKTRAKVTLKKTGTWTEYTLKVIGATANTKFKFFAPAEKRIFIDEVEVFLDKQAVSVSAAGLATFASNYALDFTSVENLEAYIATTDGSTIALAKKNIIPANTGVLLRALNDATDFNVPVTTAAADNVTGNLFVRGTGAAVESGSGPYNYVLAKHGSDIGFYKANGIVVATDKAYLQTTVAAARIDIDFDGDVTAIETVKSEKANNEYFNLAGQRVANPTKGLYIVNGRKVVVK